MKEEMNMDYLDRTPTSQWVIKRSFRLKTSGLCISSYITFSCRAVLSPEWVLRHVPVVGVVPASPLHPSELLRASPHTHLSPGIS